VNSEKQEDLKEIVWCISPIADVLRRHGLKPETGAAGDDFDAILMQREMPRTLNERAFGRYKFHTLAEKSLKDACCSEGNLIPSK